jgi:DNA-binding winged helix-turn-helix (wHTH) protein
MNTQDPGIYRFGPFTLDPRIRSLRRNGEPLDTPDKSLDLLCYFVAHPGVVASKDDLLAAVWKGVTVVPNNVDKQIANLRKILGKNLEGQDYIETVYGEGYLFTPEVEQIQRIVQLQRKVRSARQYSFMT